ncbi:MAG: lipase family protein [Bryobacteraceae bacterium]
MAKPKKDLLPDVYDNLFHAPDPAVYGYFAAHQKHPFQLAAPNLALVNAWWAADSAVLSYVNDQAKVEAVLAAAGFTQPAFFGNWGGVHPEDGPTQCFLAQHGNLVIASFRGTEKEEFADLVDDLRLFPSDQGDFWAHQGFCSALDRVWPKVKTHLDAILQTNPAAEIWFTGHSLGAALATLAACRYNGKARSTLLYTFGSPRVGSITMGAKLAGCHNYRFVNSSDVVTLVPLPPIYCHTGQEIYITSTGALLDSVSLGDLVLAALRHDGAALVLSLATLEKALANKGSGSAPPYIVGNHSPARYPTLIWNAM